MAITFQSLIEKEVDRLFAEIDCKPGGLCMLPATGAQFVWGVDPIATLKKTARLELLAREWFALNSPLDAPQLPLNIDERDRLRSSGGIGALVGFYARSLYPHDYDVRKHPSFEDFARGLMAIAIKRGLWGLEKDEALIRRFPPRPLEGMDEGGAYWDPPRKIAKRRRAA